MVKTSKYNYNPIEHTRKKRKLDYYVCDNCFSKVAFISGVDIKTMNNGICFLCKKGNFIGTKKE